MPSTDVTSEHGRPDDTDADTANAGAAGAVAAADAAADVERRAGTDADVDADHHTPPQPLGGRHVALVFAVVVAVRWWISHDRTIFHLSPDEPGQLAMARFLAGGTRWNMFDHSTWRPAYATLIAPIHWFTGDPTTAFRVAIGVNAVLGGVAAILLLVLARRLTDLPPAWCAAAAVTVSLLPAASFPTAWVWSENMVVVAYLATVLALVTYVERPRLGYGVAAGLLGALAFTSHSRMLPLAVVVVATAGVLAWRRRVTPVEAVAVAAVTAAATWLSAAYAAALVDRVWEDPTSTNTVSGVLQRLGRPGAVALSAVGQTWYQLVATASLVAIGVVVLVRATFGRPGAIPPPVAASRAVLAATAPLVALSVVFMADRWRPDHLVYGRYNDAVVGPVLLVGVATLLRRRPDRRVLLAAVSGALLAVAGALVLLAFRSDELAAGAGLRPMVIGLQALAGDAAEIPVVRITVVSTLLAAVLVGAACAPPRVRRPVLVGTLAVLLLAATSRTAPTVERALNAWAGARPVEEIQDSILPLGRTVRFKQVPDSEDPSASWSDQRHRRMIYQFYLPHNPMVLDGDPVTDRRTPYVFAPLRDPELSAAGAELLWRDPTVSMGLWREP